MKPPEQHGAGRWDIDGGGIHRRHSSSLKTTFDSFASIDSPLQAFQDFVTLLFDCSCVPARKDCRPHANFGTPNAKLDSNAQSFKIVPSNRESTP